MIETILHRGWIHIRGRLLKQRLLHDVGHDVGGAASCNTVGHEECQGQKAQDDTALPESSAHMPAPVYQIDATILGLNVL